MPDCCEHNHNQNKNHNCLEELSLDHKKILESFDKLEKFIQEAPIDKNKIKEFLDFTKNFSEPHHQKEEKILFPKLEERGMPNEGGPIGMMLFEHTTKRNYIAKIEEGVQENNDAKIKENGQAATSLMREHIFKEDNILYPCARDILTEEDLNFLARSCKIL